MLRKEIKLKPYQERGVSFLFRRGVGLIADEMGLGKTIQAIAYADGKGHKALVICPAYLIPNWKDEIKKFVGKSEARFKIISYNAVTRLSLDYFTKFSAVILDESQYIKNMEAQRTQAIIQLYSRAKGMDLIFLSGTPIENKIEELYTVLMLLEMSGRSRGLKSSRYFNNREEFIDLFRNKKLKRIGNKRVWEYFGTRNMSLLRKILKGKMIRRLAKNELDLPPIVKKVIQVKLKDFGVIDKRLEIEFKYGASHTTTSKVASAKAKAHFTAKYLKDLLEEVKNAVVFSDHPEALEIIYAKLFRQYKIGILTGGTPVKKRFSLVKDFNAGKIDLLLCSINAAGTGFNMTGSADLVFNDLSWVPSRNRQAFKRIHRIGQMHKFCRLHFIVGSVQDRKIIKKLTEKESEIGEVYL